MKQEQSKKLLLVDGHSILNRAFYGLPDLTNTAGLHTGAVYGFLTMLFRFLELEKPTHLTVAFDEHAPTFRHKMYEAYKGTRKPMAEELRMQVPMIRKMLEAMGVTVISKPGLEADDLLGTMAKTAESAGFDVTILSGDRDLLQLASDRIKISIPKTKKGGTEIENYYAKDVLENLSVTPLEFIDVKALMGDTADNIPGVPGIGAKTATDIIVKYHSIEEAHAHASELRPPRASKNILEYYDLAVLSKELATIEVHADIDYSLEDAILSDLYRPEAYELCKEWEFKNLLPRFSVVPQKNEMTDSFYLANDREDFFARVEDFAKDSEANYIGLYLAFTLHSATEQVKNDLPFFTIHGLALASENSAVWCSDLSLDDLQKVLDRLLSSGKKIATLSGKELIKIADADATCRKLSVDNLFDVSVAEYLLAPLKKEYLTEDLAATYLDILIPGYKELFAKKTLAEAIMSMPEEFLSYACYQAYVCAAVAPKQLEALADAGMLDLYQKIELPLVFTLSDMELSGIAMDGDALALYGEKLSQRILELEKTIYQEAEMEFNINSPKQLGEILFEKLELPGGKKTKTGYSTAADVLEGLAISYPIVADILEYRQLAKLKSTYADGLLACVAPDGRIHSTFQQTVTATGRISSTEPNLQNIPVRMELGKQIRKVFKPRDGYVFVDADYSQIELRVLSHMSGDENLIDAFLQGQDIHRSTASLVFHTPFDEVSDLQRRNAKAVNFGIVYGISAFGLSKDLGIDRKEAAKYIEDYFVAYPRMKEFLDGLVETGKKDGSVKTMYGRIRPIPELSSSNFMQKQFGERIAMNSPIQGTAADIIKIAMVSVHDRLLEEGLSSCLLLQVHDELLIEAKEEELEKVKEILAKEMEGAAKLLVPLTIDMHTGKTWYDAK